MTRQRIEPGQEPVWDYPWLEDSERRVKVVCFGDFYGDWVSAGTVGPFEGGTWGW